MTLLDKKKLKYMDGILAAMWRVPGAMIEVGVYRGGGLKFISDRAYGKQVYGYDTFEGLPTPGEFDRADRLPQGRFSDTSMERVQSLVPNAILIKGTFPDTYAGHPIAFAHLDVDYYEGTLKSLRAIWKNLQSGGVVLLDDYRFFETPGVDKAVKEFREEEPLALFFESPDTYQCYFMKG